MSWFPIFMELEGKKCLVAGGGRLALQKVEKLLPCGARIRLVAPEALPDLQKLDVEWIRRPVEPGDVDGMALVVDATGEEAVGKRLAAQCRAQGVPLNVVDTPALCSFIFPAVLRRGRLVAGVSTGGASPAAAAWARDLLGEALPDGMEEILEQMEILRGETRQKLPEQQARAAFLKRCLSGALAKGGALSAAEVGAVWEAFL